MCMGKINYFLNRTIRSFPNETHTTTRWAIFQTTITVSIFFISLCIAFLLSYLSIGGGEDMGVVAQWILFSFMMLMGVIGIGIFVFAIYLAFHYLDKGTEDPTATKTDIRSLKARLSKLEKKIK